MNKSIQSYRYLFPIAAWLMVQSSVVYALTELEAEVLTNTEVSRQTSRSIRQYLNGKFEPADAAETSTFNTWGSAAYTNLEFNSAGDVDLYQAVGGVDKQWGDLAAGASVAYAHSESGGTKINLPVIVPYIGYQFNRYLNTVVMAGYIRGEGNGDLDIHSNTAFTDISLNGVLPIVGGLSLQPRAGYRFKYSNIGVDEFSNVDLDVYQNTLYGQAALAYRAGNLHAYFDSLYERVATDTELPNPVDDGANFVFVTAGFNYDVTDALTLGVAYRHEINNDNLDYHQGW